MDEKKKNVYIVDRIALILTIFSMMALLQLATVHQNELIIVVRALLLFSFATSGLLMSLLLHNIRIDFKHPPPEEIFNIIFYTVGGLFTIGISVMFIRSLSTVPQIFVIIAAISEELLFRLFLYSFLRNNIPGGVFFGILINSAFFTFFHFYVYNSPNELCAVFITGIIFTITYERTKRISVSMLIHTLNNIAASGILLR